MTAQADDVARRRPYRRCIVDQKEEAVTTTRMYPYLGAACGGLFSIGLFTGASEQMYPLALAGLALFVPFLGYLCSVLRDAEGEHGWLSGTALAAGIAGITLKLASIAPEIAIRRHDYDGAGVHRALTGIADGATVLCLWPLGVFAGAVAILVLRTHVLPRWLGAMGGFTAVALIVNGSIINAGFVPALLLFVAWVLALSIVLVRRAAGESAPVSPGYAPVPG